MAKQFLYKMRNKKALSAVVTMVLIIALVVAVVGVVFTLTKKTVEGEIEKSEACGLNLLDKFSINSEFVCYDEDEDRFVFSITRGDIDVDSLLVGIETETQIIQYGIRKGDNTLTNLISYPEKDKSTSLPLKKGGATYIATRTYFPA